MCPEVAAAEDARRELIREAVAFEVFEKLPEFPALLFGQVFHGLRRARRGRVTFFYQLHECAERVFGRARAERRGNGFDMFPEVESDIAHVAVGRFERADVVDGERALRKARFFRDGALDDEQYRLGDSAPRADDVQLERLLRHAALSAHSPREETRAVARLAERPGRSSAATRGGKICALVSAREQYFRFRFRCERPCTRIPIFGHAHVVERREAVVFRDANRGAQKIRGTGVPRVFEPDHRKAVSSK